MKTALTLFPSHEERIMTWATLHVIKTLTDGQAIEWYDEKRCNFDSRNVLDHHWHDLQNIPQCFLKCH